MWFLFACIPISPAPAPEPITDVVTVETDGVSVEDMNALEDRVERRMESYEERIGNLEMQVAELQQAKLANADQIAFDPSKTTLEADDVQLALDELAVDVARLQGQEVDMGEPSDKLFEIPKDPEPDESGDPPKKGGKKQPKGDPNGGGGGGR